MPCASPFPHCCAGRRLQLWVASCAARSILPLTLQLPLASQVTTLPNKVRVATESTPGHFHAVGVYVDAGSRFESHRTSGVSHLLDRLAFKVGSPARA